jgi:hypothetical protein
MVSSCGRPTTRARFGTHFRASNREKRMNERKWRCCTWSKIACLEVCLLGGVIEIAGRSVNGFVQYCTARGVSIQYNAISEAVKSLNLRNVLSEKRDLTASGCREMGASTVSQSQPDEVKGGRWGRLNAEVCCYALCTVCKTCNV